MIVGVMPWPLSLIRSSFPVCGWSSPCPRRLPKGYFFLEFVFQDILPMWGGFRLFLMHQIPTTGTTCTKSPGPYPLMFLHFPPLSQSPISFGVFTCCLNLAQSPQQHASGRAARSWTDVITSSLILLRMANTCIVLVLALSNNTFKKNHLLGNMQHTE